MELGLRWFIYLYKRTWDLKIETRLAWGYSLERSFIYKQFTWRWTCGLGIVWAADFYYKALLRRAAPSKLTGLENLAQASMISPQWLVMLLRAIQVSYATIFTIPKCQLCTELRTLVTNGEAKRIWVLSLDVLSGLTTRIFWTNLTRPRCWRPKKNGHPIKLSLTQTRGQWPKGS